MGCAVAKWGCRLGVIRGAGQAASVNVPVYNSKAFSCLQYILQCAEPTQSMYRREFGYVHSLYHVPYSTFDAETIHCLSYFGLKQPQLLSVNGLAAKIRYYINHSGVVDRGVRVLGSIFDKLSLSAVAKGFQSPTQWSFKPYVLQIHDAVHGSSLRAP
eukprot:7221624-Karenia_brevis.AAC.1